LSSTVPPTPPARRFETALTVLQLLGDLLSNPFHLAAYLLTGRSRRRRLMAALQEAAP
jgi:hypothetical protein